MRRHMHGEIAVFILGVFVAGMVCMSAFPAAALAAEKKNEVEVVGEEVKGAEVAGEEGGTALFEGISKGTVVTAAVVTAIVAGAVIAVSGNDDSDSTTTTTHH